MIKCRKCGKSVIETSRYGKYLKRVNPKGEMPFIGECAPNCPQPNEEPDQPTEVGLLRALEDSD